MISSALVSLGIACVFSAKPALLLFLLRDVNPYNRRCHRRKPATEIFCLCYLACGCSLLYCINQYGKKEKAEHTKIS